MFFRIPKIIVALLAILAAAAAQTVDFHRSPGKIEVSVEGKPFSNFYYGPEWPQPFLHPLRTASGLMVTRGYPVMEIEGESRDHKWHHGLWFSHGDINGVDFWRDKGPEPTGRIVPCQEPKAAGNTVSGQFRLVTPERRVLGTIDEAFRFDAHGPLRIVDVHVTIHADQSAAIRMGDTEEGALGIRLRDEFREDHGAVLTNSDGLTGSKNIWGKRASWVDYSTGIGREKVGVIMMDHPTNPKHPTYWHARNYGLNAANPFGEHDFLKDKTRDGSTTSPAGKSSSFLYRVVIHPGMLDRAEANRWFNEFAKEKP